MTLSAFQAFCISALISASYVGGLYISQSGRLSFSKHGRLFSNRDDSAVIQARLKAILISTCLSCGVVYLCIAGNVDDRSAIESILKALGLTLSKKSLKAHFLIPILYTGPLVAQYLSGRLPFQRYWSLKDDLWSIFSTWIGFRNYIAAPISEEIVFRACLLIVAKLSQQGWYKMVFATPLWFGAAHLHHAYEIYTTFGRTRLALKRAITTCLIQFTYTTLFGAYVSFLFLRTESVLPSITAHITANLMGLPALSSELRQHPKHKLLIILGYAIGVMGFISASAAWTS